MSATELADRAVDAVLLLVRRGMALAGGVLIFAVIASVGGFLLGMAALSDGMRTVWIFLGGAFALIAIGSVVIVMLRLSAVRRTADELVDEVRELITQRASRDAVETAVITTAERDDDGVVQLSRHFVTIRGAIGDRVGQFAKLSTAIGTMTTFPGLLAIATLISIVFLGLSALFLIGLVI